MDFTRSPAEARPAKRKFGESNIVPDEIQGKIAKIERFVEFMTGELGKYYMESRMARTIAAYTDACYSNPEAPEFGRHAQEGLENLRGLQLAAQEAADAAQDLIDCAVLQTHDRDFPVAENA